MSKLAAFVSERAGFTGAEKALVACTALAVILGVGTLVSRGGQRAGGDARQTLMDESGGAGGNAAVGEIAYVSAMAPPEAAGNEPPKAAAAAPAPAAAQRPARDEGVTYEPRAYNRNGRVEAVVLVRLGVLPKNDPVLAALRDELGASTIRPDQPEPVTTLWEQSRGGSATTDGRGNVVITQGDRRVVVFRDGAIQVVEPHNHSLRDADGRLRSFSFTETQGRNEVLRQSYHFGYGPDGQLRSVEQVLGDKAGKWVKGDDGLWRNERTREVYRGADGPETWAAALGGRTRLLGVMGAANGALDGEWKRLQRMWSDAFPQGRGGFSEVTSTMTALRNVVGMGYSGEGGNVIQMSGQIKTLRAEMDALDRLRAQVQSSTDPAEIRRLSNDYVRRAEDTRVKLEAFRVQSERVLRNADRYGRAWEIGKDIYGLGTAGGPIGGGWNLQNLVRHSLGAAESKK